jgi:hypothetical protein
MAKKNELDSKRDFIRLSAMSLLECHRDGGLSEALGAAGRWRSYDEALTPHSTNDADCTAGSCTR